MTNDLISSTIISTASVESSISLVQQLAELGVQVYTFPMIEFLPIHKSLEIQRSLSSIFEYQWIIFTSKFGVQYFFESLREYSHTYELPKHIRIACVGQKTADVLVRYNYSASYVCPHNNGDDFSNELRHLFKHELVRVLFPTGNLTQNMISLRMPESVTIDKIIVYHTIQPQSYNPKILELISVQQYSYIVFTSPSAVTNFVNFFKDILPISELRTVSIGPATTKKLHEFGFESIVHAKEYTYSGIVAAIKTNQL